MAWPFRRAARKMRVSLPQSREGTASRPGGADIVRYASNQEPLALTASGERIDAKLAEQLRRLVMPWQQRALYYYDALGEIKYAAQFYSRALSQLELIVMHKDPDTGELTPSDDPEATALLERIQDPGGGRSALLGSYGRLRFLCGEALLLWTKADDGTEQWEMLSSDELRIQGKTYYRYKAPTLAAETLNEAADDAFEIQEIAGGDTAIAYRLWNRHPRYSAWPDSTMQGVLDICEELLLLTKAVRARARSRLAGNGVLWIDDRLTPAPMEPVPDEDTNEDTFMSALTSAMMAPLADAGAASAVVPIIARVPVPPDRTLEQLVMHQQFVDPTQLYPETGLRRECIERIAIGLDMPPEILLGLADSNHWCQTSETEVMAKGRGWIRHLDLSLGDEVYSLNHETGEGEWNPVLDIYRADVTDETLYALDSDSHASRSTPEHRWPIVKTGYKVAGSRRRWTTSAEGFAASDRVPVAASLADQAEPVYADDFVRLVVAFTSDGTSREHGNIRIVKFAEREIAEMRRILTSLYGSGGFREHPHTTRTVDGVAFVLRQAEARNVHEVCGENKAVRLDFVDDLTPEQRHVFLISGVEIGDGVSDDASSTLYQVEPARLDAFAYAAHLSGYKVTSGIRNQQTGFGTRPLSWIRWTMSRTTFAPSKCDESLVAYTGVVWCPVTKNGTWFARLNGKAYFTGNSAWQIDEQVWKAHLQPIAQGLVDDLTSSYFRPTLVAAKHPDALNLVIGYDASRIINHPDRARDAKDVYDRRGIGKAALREATGFDDSDAPTEDELHEMVGIATRDSSLAVYGIPQVKSGGLEEASGEVTAIPVPGGTVPAPANAGPGAGSAADVTPGAPPEPSASDTAVTGGGNGHRQPREWQIEGACELALLRCRESAGNRLRSALRKDKETAAQMKDVPAGGLCAAVGATRTRELTRMTEVDLVGGTRLLLIDALMIFGVRDDRATQKVCGAVEQYAARTLYDARPAPLPPQFAALVRLVAERDREATPA